MAENKNDTGKGQASIPSPIQGEADAFNRYGHYKESLLKKTQAGITQKEPRGLIVTKNIIPPGILVFNNYIHPGDCDAMIRYADKMAGTDLMVQNVDESSDSEVVSKLSEQRITEYVPIDGIEKEMNTLFSRLIRQRLAPYYGVEFEWYERPQILRYAKGGKYEPHADSEYWDEKRQEWRRSLDRDYSLLVYLNEDFEGGSVFFPNFGFRVRPKKGMVIAFPSDHRYLHAAEELTKGKRYAVVTWAAVKGSPRVMKSAPSRSVFFE